MKRFEASILAAIAFCAIAANASPVSATNFTFAGVGKDRIYVQTGTGISAPSSATGSISTELPYGTGFLIDGLSTSPSLSVSGVSLTAPDSSNILLSPLAAGHAGRRHQRIGQFCMDAKYRWNTPQTAFRVRLFRSRRGAA